MRRFAEWGTVWRESYRSDLFFRTTAHIVGLQALLVLVLIGVFWASLRYANKEVAEAVVAHVVRILENNSSVSPETFTQTVQGLQADVTLLMFLGIVVLAVIFGFIISSVTLRPARETLRYQKLFISNVAHELRTPLSTIKTSTEVALLDDKLPLSQRKTLLTIISELDRVSEIINNLLSLNTFTRPERMQLQDIDLGPIVETVVRRHTELANERDVKVIVKMDAHRIVWGNASGLEQVITNLLKNAISYTPKEAGGMVTVSVTPDYHGMVTVSVEDNGIGIAQEDLFHIFEPFYRADTSRVRQIRQGGSGLGLTIVNEIVRVHHGRIRVQSALRKGTTVSVYLHAGTSSEPHNTEIAPTERGRHSEVSMDFSKGFNSNIHAQPKNSSGVQPPRVKV